MKRIHLLILILMTGAVLSPMAGAEDSGTEMARAGYDHAQSLKRDGRFVEARAAFQELAGTSGDSSWSTLAADELRYGLPLHESNVLMAQLAHAGDHPSRTRLLKRIDSLYQAMLNDNMDRPERVSEIERKRDQLSLVRQMAGTAEQDSMTTGLRQLRHQIQNHHSMTGHWPDRRQIAAVVSAMLNNAGLPADRLTLFDFYPTSSSFYATLRDSRGGPDIKIKGDDGNVRIEGGGL